MESCMLQIPQLTTDRLLLRGFRPDDFERHAEMMADPDVSRHLMGGRPLTRIEAWRQLAMFAGHWVLRGYGLWAVEERATGEFLGRIGCLNPEGFPAFEIAYTLAPWAWGKGYGAEERPRRCDTPVKHWAARRSRALSVQPTQHLSVLRCRSVQSRAS